MPALPDSCIPCLPFPAPPGYLHVNLLPGSHEDKYHAKDLHPGFQESREA